MTTIQQTRTGRSAPLRQRLLATGAAVVGAVLIWLVAVPVIGVQLRGPAGPGTGETKPVIFPAVVAVSLAASLAGWALLSWLERRNARARTIWTRIAVGVLVVSYGGPLFAANVPTASRITLSLMHTTVGLVLITMLRRTSTTK